MPARGTGRERRYDHRVPSPDRTYPVAEGAAPASGLSPSQTSPSQMLAAAVQVLTDPALEHVVDLVAWPERGRDGETDVVVANCRGRARLTAQRPRGELLEGEHPVANQDPLHSTPRQAALTDPSPPNARNSYPFAYARLTSAFGDPERSPDLVVVHTPRHHWPERGGHLGEHGSLDAGQSRAPLILSGAGIAARGMLPRAARVVDIGPTLAALCGADMPGVDGVPLADLLEPGTGPPFVVGLLWDGANANDLYAMAAGGELPAVARLLEHGGALQGGAIAEFPSVTLVNHTSALTGLGPGRHGIVGNVFHDRRDGERVLANDAATWHRACDLLRPAVRTVFEAVGGGACVNEPIDRGADYSTFGLVRASGQSGGAGALSDALPPAADDTLADQSWVAREGHYAWSSQVDALGLTQVCQLWSAEPGPPRLTWWNTTLTDTGHHGGGPYSPESRAALRDADRRLGAFLDLLDAQGLTEHVAFLLTADHGSEGADPGCTGDWDEALQQAGIAFRDEGYGSIYLG